MMKPIRSLLFTACFLATTLAPWSEADAALNAYLQATGQKQGKIRGSVTKKGHENKIAVLSWSHEIVSPRDAASGLPTGKRQHKPILITKEIDKSTPLLFQALVDNEKLTSVELAVFADDDKTGTTPIYTVRLTNAEISQIRMETQGEGKDAKEVMVISLVYQKIEWVWNDGGITAMDDWETPVVKKGK